MRVQVRSAVQLAKNSWIGSTIESLRFPHSRWSLGWVGTAAPLSFPAEIIGQPRHQLEPSFRHLDRQLLAKYRARGTLQDWQRKIGNLCCR